MIPDSFFVKLLVWRVWTRVRRVVSDRARSGCGLTPQRLPRAPSGGQEEQRAHGREAAGRRQVLADLRRIDRLALLAEADPVGRRSIVVDQLRRAARMSGDPA